MRLPEIPTSRQQYNKQFKVMLSTIGADEGSRPSISCSKFRISLPALARRRLYGIAASLNLYHFIRIGSLHSVALGFEPTSSHYKYDALPIELYDMVRAKGHDPSIPYGQWFLRPFCMPIPTHSHLKMHFPVPRAPASVGSS